MKKSIKVFYCLIFCFFIIPFKTHSAVTDISVDVSAKERFTGCYSVFSNSELNHERYSEADLKTAMENLDYEKIKDMYPVLKEQTVEELFQLYKEQNDEWAFQVLFLSNIRLVYFMVKIFKGTTDKIRDDLIQEGMIGLLHAIRYFKPEEGTKFSTYARTTIWGQLKRYEEQKERQVPRKWTERRKKFYYFLLAKMKENPSSDISQSWIDEFLQQNPGFPAGDIRYVLLFMEGSHVSLETPVGDNGDTALSNFIPDDRIDIEREIIFQSDLQQVYDWAVEAVRKAKKPAHYEVIIRDRMFSESPRTLEDIASQFNLSSKQSVKWAEEAIKKMIRRRFRRYKVEYVNLYW